MSATPIREHRPDHIQSRGYQTQKSRDNFDRIFGKGKKKDKPKKDDEYLARKVKVDS